MLPFYGILLRTPGKLQHTVGNDQVHASHRSRHRHHKCRRKRDRFVRQNRYHEPSQRRQSGRPQHNPDQREYNPPSLQDQALVNTRLSNDHRRRRNRSRHQYTQNIVHETYVIPLVGYRKKMFY
jgi:hypothetical protein